MRVPVLVAIVTASLLGSAARAQSGGPESGSQLAPSHYTFTPVIIPSATASQALGINDFGVVVGQYTATNAPYAHGFQMVGSQITPLNYPSSLATSANGINSSGDVVGSYVETRSGSGHAFLFQNGSFSS